MAVDSMWPVKGKRSVRPRRPWLITGNNDEEEYLSAGEGGNDDEEYLAAILVSMSDSGSPRPPPPLPSLVQQLVSVDQSIQKSSQSEECSVEDGEIINNGANDLVIYQHHDDVTLPDQVEKEEPAPPPERYGCSLCNKSFSSSRALGGHKASHSDRKKAGDASAVVSSRRRVAIPPSDGAKVHTCLICFEQFPTGQALGGHKRRHFTGEIGSAVGSGTSSSVMTVAASAVPPPAMEPPPPPPVMAAPVVEELDLELRLCSSYHYQLQQKVIEDEEVQSPHPFKKIRF